MSNATFERRAVNWRLGLVLGVALSLIGSLSPAAPADEVALEHVETLDDWCEPQCTLPGSTTAATPRYYPDAGYYESIQVNVYDGGADCLLDAANEPSIAVDPTNRNNMVIGWRQFNCSSSNFREAGYAFSTDGGRTWTHPGVLVSEAFRSDPVIQPDAAGNFYYYSLRGPMLWECDLFKSTDGGQTWGSPLDGKGGDKAWMAIDRVSPSGGGRGNIYSVWNLTFTCCPNHHVARSTDGGLNWLTQTTSPAVQPSKWGTVEVGADGTVYIVGTNGANTAVRLAKSLNAKDPNETPVWDSVQHNPSLGGRVPYVSNPLFTIDPNPAGLHGQLWIAAHGEGSGEHLYVLGSVLRDEEPATSVWFASSSDRGDSWQSAVRVFDNPDDSWQWFGTMSLSPNGRIDVIWNDTSGDTADPPKWSHLLYASSTNGGESFSSPAAVSPWFKHHDGYPTNGIDKNQKKLGDYYTMVSDNVGANVAYAATFNYWDDEMHYTQDIYFLRIGDYDCNMNDIGDLTDISSGTSQDVNENGIPDECE